MKVKIKWTKDTLANNIRHYRAEHGFSQKEIAQQTGISYRLIQDLEAGVANPTMDTLHKMAVSFKMTMDDLMSLSHLRLPEDDTTFVDRFKEAFKTSKLAVAIRTLSGISIWGNKVIEKFHGGRRFDRGSVDLMEFFPSETRALLKNQMAAEKNGFAYPYTMAHLNPKIQETIYVRSHPTLILPNKGHTPMYTAVYASEISENSAELYYEYCKSLLEVVYQLQQ